MPPTTTASPGRPGSLHRVAIATDWGPVLFTVLIPLLSAGVVLALRVATRQGQLAEQVRQLRSDVAQLEGEVRRLLRVTAQFATRHRDHDDGADT